MGHRLGISNNFQREAVLRQTFDNKNLSINNRQTSSKNTSFGGFSDSLIKTNKWLNDGNYVKSFLILDTCGFILPRIFQAFMRNKEELGGYNYKAATEEAIREFLSGPGIFAVPFASILVAKKCIGSATNVANNALEVFSDKFASMPDNLKTNFEATKKDFYSRVLNDTFKTHLLDKEKAGEKINDKTSQEVVDDITKKIIDLETEKVNLAKMKRFPGDGILINPKMKQFENNKIAPLESDITTMVVNLNNRHGKFTNNKANIALANKAELNIITLADYMSYYANDIVKTVCDDKSADKAELIKKLNKKAKNGKTILNLTAIALTAAFTYCVPMLYKRNKTYPGTEGLINKTNPASQPSKQEAK
ncbi:MAG: hypothetical protein PHC34_08050 [Candidatus Gastranaerophilales bacterium]|nr:hypothetical protein [Candidatus Gastranaerophilales bacterium]